jgi:hypothetical protein
MTPTMMVRITGHGRELYFARVNRAGVIVTAVAVFPSKEHMVMTLASRKAITFRLHLGTLIMAKIS